MGLEEATIAQDSINVQHFDPKLFEGLQKYFGKVHKFFVLWILLRKILLWKDESGSPGEN